MSKAEETAWRAAMACQKAADALLGGSWEACKGDQDAFAAYLEAYGALRDAQKAAAKLGAVLGEKGGRKHD